MDLTVVLVNYKCDKIKLNNCLNSININVKVIIIDHSNDFTTDGLNIPKNIILEVYKKKNLGNGAGINRGFELVGTRYILYLDIDTTLAKNFFLTINDSLKKIKNFAVILPKIENHYKGPKLFGGLLWWQFLYNKIFFKIKKRDIVSEYISEVFTGSGAIMLIDKKNTFEKNIKFDENIFLYFEENDFFHECFKAGQKIFILDNLKCYHFDGSINDDSLEYECFKKWHWEWSKYYFFNKHYNFYFISMIALKNIFIFSIKILFFFFLNRAKFNIFKSRLNGIISYYKNKNSYLRL